MTHTVFSVNEVIDRLDELHGQLVQVTGLLSFGFENHSIDHYPTAERRERDDGGIRGYRSSIWITFGTGSIQPDVPVLTRWWGKRVRVSGVVRKGTAAMGCGHGGLWDCDIEVYAIDRI